MNDIIKKHHPIRHAKSVKYAFSGIVHALLNEANFRVQVIIVAISTALGTHFKISNVEWGLLIISMGSLLAAELVNTVVEEFIDHLIKEYSEIVKIIKDVSAGFVLITAVSAGMIFILIFGHRMPTLLAVEQSITHTNSQQTIPIDKTLNNNASVKNTINTKQEYYGHSLNTSCTTSNDCIALGCNREICGAINDSIESMCVVPNKPLPSDLGYKCSCIQQKCIWNK